MSASNQICIKDGMVTNIIFADDDFVATLNQTKQYDMILNGSNYPNQSINIGYTYDGNNFAPPILAQLDANTMVQIKIQKAIIGFNTILVQYAASNVLMGITQLGKTQLISDTLQDVQRYGQSGSLYAAITELQSIVLTPQMAPFLTPAIVASLVQQTQTVINSL